MATQFRNFKSSRPIARLIDARKCTYEVFFIAYGPDKKEKRFRFSKGINCLNPKERKDQAQAYADMFREAMQKGWNPFKEELPQFEKHQQQIQQYTFSSGLDFALSIKKQTLSKWSYPDYKGTVRFMEKAAKECGYIHAPVASMERKDIRAIIGAAKEKNEWSSNARNKYLSLLKSLLTVLVDEEILKYNPAHRIKDEKAPKGQGYKRLTDQEQEIVANHVYENTPDFYEYIMCIFDLLIRRKELLMVQVKHVNLQLRKLTITEDVAKTNTQRVIPITDNFLEILMRRQVWSLPKDWYIFSSDSFAPGPAMYHPNTPTNWWRKIVIHGLGIDCKLYSLKHKGADKKILDGISLKALKGICGHKSEQMTEIYAEAIKEVYAQEIIGKPTEFRAKVVAMRKAE